MRMKAIERLGFGYEAVRHLNPGVIYCVATGFGQDGPDKDKPAFDDIIQASSGFVGVSSMGKSAPEYSPNLIADKTVGLYMSNAVRSEEHTSELQSLMRISYAVFCLKKKNSKLHTAV